MHFCLISYLCISVATNVALKPELFVSFYVVKVDATEALELLAAARPLAHDPEGFPRVVLNAMTLKGKV